MSDGVERLDRRRFFERALALGVAALGTGAVLTGCDKDRGAVSSQNKPAARVDCADVSGLSDSELGTRKALQYVEQSAKPGQQCNNCKLFLEKEPCDGCSALPGPVQPEGWCTAWIAEA